MNKKILIVTYYWPPNGSSGVQRWLKFVKYLHREGWEPIVYTPLNPVQVARDSSWEKDIPKNLVVLRQPIFEWQDFFQKIIQRITGKEKKYGDWVAVGKKSFFTTLFTWIRGNFFIPDGRVAWVNPSVKFLSTYIEANQIQRIVTTGPPHSMHLIGLRLKEKFPRLFWLSDFRDPWSEWDILEKFHLTSFARKKHQRLEKNVLQKSDVVTTVSPYLAKRLSELGNRSVELITNGFDEEDFPATTHESSNFIVRYVGVVEHRDPRPFFRAAVEAMKQNEALKTMRVEFNGHVHQVLQEEVKQNPAWHFVSFTGQLTHQQIVPLYAQSAMLLLILSPSQNSWFEIPAKTFEYIAARKPVLGIGPPTCDAAKILALANAGTMVSQDDESAMTAFLLHTFEQWKNKTTREEKNVSAFSRKSLTKKLITLLEAREPEK